MRFLGQEEKTHMVHIVVETLTVRGTKQTTLLLGSETITHSAGRSLVDTGLAGYEDTSFRF